MSVTPRPTLIALHKTMWGNAVELPLALPGGWEITADPRRLHEAGVVVFHVPELRFYHRPRKRPGQLWVAWSIESVVHYPQLADPSFLSRFDLTMTYQRTCDVLWGYVPFYSNADNLERALGAPPQPKDAGKAVVMFVSSRVDRSGRTSYLRELMRHIPIDSYGRLLNNVRLQGDGGRSTKLRQIARYPFTIAFENSIADDYVTEKFYDPLVAGSVPLYLGAPNVRELAPSEDCFIDVTQYESPRRLAEHLRTLLANPVDYERLFSWKQRPFQPGFRQFLDQQRSHPWVRLCEAVDRRRAQAVA